MHRRSLRVLLVVIAACDENSSTRSSPTESLIDPHVGYEVPLEYRKVFNTPKLAELREDGASDAVVRTRWAEGMSKLGSVASLHADGTTLVVTYSPSVRDRACVAENWAKLYDLPRLEFTAVRCASGGEARVPDDGGRAKRERLLEQAHAAVTADDVGLSWSESEGMVVTAIIELGKCNRTRLKRIAAKLKKAGIDLRSVGFEKLVCSVDPGEIPL